MKKSEVKAIVKVLSVIAMGFFYILVGIYNLVVWLIKALHSKGQSLLEQEASATSLDSKTERDDIDFLNEQVATKQVKPKSSKFIDTHENSSLADLVHRSTQKQASNRFDQLPAAQDAHQCWIPPGQSVDVLNYTIADGMVYVGNGLRMVNSVWEIEPALINPELDIANPNADPLDEALDRWPSYQWLPEIYRAKYLFWLATGKKNPDVPEAYVYLYFYGLERRLLCECKTSAEREKLLAEVLRLKDCYAHFEEFAAQASALHRAALSSTISSYQYHFKPNLKRSEVAQSLPNRMGIAQLIRDRQPIPATWAVAWLVQDGYCDLQGSMAALSKSHLKQFIQSYKKRFGKGFLVSPSGDNRLIEYTPVNTSLANLELDLQVDLIDPLSLKEPRTILQDIYNQSLRIEGMDPASTAQIDETRTVSLKIPEIPTSPEPISVVSQVNSPQNRSDEVIEIPEDSEEGSLISTSDPDLVEPTSAQNSFLRTLHKIKDSYIELDLGNLGETIISEYRSHRSMGNPKPNRSQKYWIPPGESVKVQGYTIADGMVYVGQGLSKIAYDWDTEPALIDPSLKVHKRRRDPDGTMMSYWPSYSHIPEECRATYLKWLAEGKADRRIDIGYVFLYFYGLERRLLAEPCSQNEQALLIVEVQRLQRLYGWQNSFASYSQKLLEILALKNQKDRFYLQDPQQESGSLINRMGLAQLIKDGRPIPANWALAWAKMSEYCNLRTPARRLSAMFAQLFEMEYQATFGEGIKVKPNKTPLKLHYRAASTSLQGFYPEFDDTLPDPLVLKKYPTKLQRIIDTCQEELEPLSRWLGRNPGEETSIRAFSLTPDRLLKTTDHPKAQIWRDLFSQLDEPQLVARDTLAAHWPFNDPQKPSKKESVELSTFLEKLGFGMEPDPRFDGPTLTKAAQVIIFPMGQDVVDSPSSDYRIATLYVHLAALVAWADDTISEDEEQQLATQIEDNPQLSDAEKQRLKAHAMWLLRVKPSMSGIKKRIDGLPTSAKSKIGDFILSTAAADGHIAPEEIKTLEKLFKNLSLDSEQIISQLHQLSTGQTTPSLKAEAVATPKAGESFILDFKAIEAKRAESEKVSQLLGDIFQDEEDPPHATPSQPETATIEGLDAAQTKLLQWLGEEEQRQRDAIDAYCESLGIFTDGALEALNELAFERCDDPLFEEDNDVYDIDMDIYKELVA